MSFKQLLNKWLNVNFASLYICHFSTAVDFSSEKYSSSTLLDTGTPRTSREIYSEDADDQANLPVR